MTFTDKYEILESLTRGRVESFVTRNLVTNERVLAHIFDCPEQKPQQPTVQWVLESFHVIAPKPAGLVIDTGQYAGTSYAYLVTKMPSEDRLRAWVQSYEAGLEQSPETSTSTAEVNKQEIAVADQPTLCGSAEAHGITAAFEALRLGLSPQSDVQQDAARANDPTDAAAEPHVQPSVTSVAQKEKKEEAGEFTKRFFPELSVDRKEPVTKVPPGRSSGHDLLSPSASPSADFEVGMPHAAESDNRSVTSVLEPMLASTGRAAETVSSNSTPEANIPSATGASARAQRAPEGSTGEFTRFLRGPFNGEHAEHTPDVQTPDSARAKNVGEFTELFGSVKDVLPVGSSPSLISTNGPAAGGDPGSITGLLGRSESTPQESVDVGEKATPPTPGPKVVVRRFSTEGDVDAPRSVDAERSAGTDHFSSGKSGGRGGASGLREVEPSFSASSEPAGATLVFSGSEREPAISRSKLPEGPSEYTRFISGGARSIPSAKEPAVAGESDSNTGRASLAVPMPAVPAAPSPVPQVPKAGHYPNIPASPRTAHIVEGGCYQGPTPPGDPMWGGLQPSQRGLDPPKAAQVPWTLILILNGLFVVAVLLVLYFALKH